ncbi:Uncharacterised protein [[Clostridium] sordellii]|uniref:hypothetical protein n=2 Tax=Paraclostridium sordellii TaxID=1505 RepID=UPI0005DB7108|nr:hypothetical protein [Paeniclostridium sordellii]MBX9179520.1 hypothetical protein [Paeniclostridium sordellii]MDU2687364.1 hypothetical protein [Paeniclostridium sordellii]CEO12351.1 Uncharacterised protein [[Clostridium] sordellii] [Paeniclostridium sordellii]CEP83561.1 Uncharacterised protein [[Clostridium] sordellii] [Paeniclostridium sordellii]
MKNETSSKINNIRYDDINDYEFENLLEEDLLDIEKFLDSYVVKKVDEEKIDLTIETLRNYMPKNSSENLVVNKNIYLLNKIRTNIELMKIQFMLFNKIYIIASLILTLGGLIGAIKYNLNPYVSSYTIAPIPVLLGLVEILRGKEEGVWELELSYKYSFREIIFAKLTIIGITSIAISLFMSFILANTYSEVNLLKLINTSLIPICFISIISLVTASIYRSMNSIALSTGIWIICSNMVDSNTFKDIANVSNLKLFTMVVILGILTIVSLRLFYKKSINFIDYKKFDF